MKLSPEVWERIAEEALRCLQDNNSPPSAKRVALKMRTRYLIRQNPTPQEIKNPLRFKPKKIQEEEKDEGREV